MSSHFEKQLKLKQKHAKVQQELQHAGATHITPSPDIHQVPGQNYCVLSYVTSDERARIKTTHDIAIKISGCFDTLEAANEHARLISEENGLFDVTVVSMYVFGIVPMSPEDAPFVKSEYADPILSSAINGMQQAVVSGHRKIEKRQKDAFHRAELAMQRKLNDPSYKMPEKSVNVVEAERKVAEQDKECKGDSLAGMESVPVRFVRQLILEYCTAHCDEKISLCTGANMMHEISQNAIKSIARLNMDKSSEKSDNI